MGYQNGQKVDITYTSDMNVETFRNKCANAFIGTKSGINAVIIDDASPIATKLDVSVSSANKITMLNATTDGYNLPVEQGKTYTLSSKLKSGVNIGDKFWGIKWTEDYNGTSTTIDEVLIWQDKPSEAKYTFTVGANNKSRDYRIYINGFSQTDFEYIQLNEGATAVPYTPYMEDTSNVTYKSYGKNLLDVKNGWEKVSTVLSAKELKVPTDCTVSILTTGIYNETDFQRVYRVQIYENNTWSNMANGTLVAYNESHKPVKITKKEGCKYRIVTNDVDYANHIIYAQNEIGKEATEYEPYEESVGGVVIGKTTTVVSDVEGFQLTVEYSRDLNGVIAELESKIQSLHSANTNISTISTEEV